MKRTLLVRMMQLLFFAAVSFANWYKTDDTSENFYLVVQAVCVVGFIAVLFSLYFSWRNNRV